jgi:hypothetical protein
MSSALRWFAVSEGAAVPIDRCPADKRGYFAAVGLGPSPERSETGEGSSGTMR